MVWTAWTGQEGAESLKMHLRSQVWEVLSVCLKVYAEGRMVDNDG